MAKQKNTIQQGLKKQFIQWLKVSLKKTGELPAEGTIKKALASVGIKGIAVFDERNSLKIRLYISELVMKRDKCKVASYEEYLTIVQCLIDYAEFLDCKDIPVKKTEVPVKTTASTTTEVKTLDLVVPEGRDKLKDTLTVAYYLSRVNNEALKELGYKTHKAAFERLAQLFGQKPATIKNMRDEFDPYFDNGRAGWYQRQMSPSRKEVYDKMASVSDEDLTSIVKEIVKAYIPVEGPVSEKTTKHRKIKIASDGMKEIRTRKK